ncbi:MAG: glycosyltransferase family 39 protein [Planctomycetota bacterium]
MKHPGATQLFALFALGHVAVWTALPTALRHVTAMDATEAAAWGRRLILGYPRNPWLSAWLARGALTLGGGRDGALYLLSQLCVLLAMWCVFRLGTRLVGAWHALVAVVILAGVQYFSIAAIDFNDNVLQLALWPAAAWAFHVALATERVRAWLLTGLLCGLALMAKYSSALLLLAMLAFLAADRTARASLARRGFLACIAALAAVAAPHLLWLARHDFITVRYLFERIDSFSAPWWQEHAGYAAKFLLNQLLTLAPAAILLATLFARASDSTLAPASSPSPFDRRLLGWLFMLPLAVTATISIVTGWNLRTMWGMPLASLASLWLVCWFPVRLTARSMRRLVILASGAVLLVGGGYALAMTRPGAIRSANLPLLEVARDVTRLWRERNHTPLAYVGGERLIASYVARYRRTSRPRSSTSTRRAVRGSPKPRCARGAAFLQFVNYHDGSATFAAELRRRFPTLEIEPIRAYPWYRADRDQEPLQVLIGLLPPARHASAPRALFDGVSLADGARPSSPARARCACATAPSCSAWAVISPASTTGAGRAATTRCRWRRCAATGMTSSAA